MYIHNFEAFIVAITILTLTPGLDTALVIRNTSRAGLKDGCVTSFGICSGLFVHAMCSAIGVSAILAQSAYWFQVVKWVGAAYLIWLGFKSLKTLFSHQVDTMQVDSVHTSHHNFNVRRSLQEGFLSNVLNPKTAVFYLAFLPQFINPQHSAVLQSLFMAGLHFLIAMIWQCSVSGLLNKAKHLLKSVKFTRWMEGTTGSVLIALGVKLMIESR
ncbi:LysE family translocator [Vibrio palustris]|uniref:Homoserine/homoserine lactone efflux protein n=1 Tax=Vibrio palustris TaxID=1918946 RepID=A0A1R4B2F6_9VIBR|nr:LysE family translocator [Vibrio palustris]SJL83083.1 Homoserine/homoserine lactone efflux protein [Vibrio palustris]